ncbi:aromatic ring-hydroxylating dioxygenase subunit alpha [Rhizorhabdus wittichii]|uniref:Aromatic ring-hydroxylating dioxygenase subunit alpha n=1 Tax=Rhizorhabdus wittichii TaxID=160791 RepID=A0A975D604_9SPHN|nr:aromatic ring-hydroxylating dioxygenase subunit alpha [Rhizorhabdus wittichii]QTH23556.1 aromatic ring-hydroxylating dioxygenase subunit alpha [Rhizorhabdus wittichii]
MRDDIRAWLDAESGLPDQPLRGEFYVDAGIFAAEMRDVLGRQWLYADHVSRIPRPGDYFLFEVGGESIIVVRRKDGTIGAYFNVCRHRGSRICLDRQGSLSSFVCPYHAWTYDLDGALRGAAHMPDDFERRDAGLMPCHVRELEGLIFLCLAEGEAPDFDALAEIARPYLALNGLATARLAARRSYPTSANWKLVVDNFQECYHCAPAHKLYSSAHSKDKLLAFGAGPGSGPVDAAERFSGELATWRERASAAGTWLDARAEEEDDIRSIWSVGRLPIKAGALTESVDGAPVSRLMGRFAEFDGGHSAVAFNVFSYFLASNDHVVMIRFTPRGVLETDVEFQWFVHPEAEEGVDYEVERLVRVWDVTTTEDKRITEDNQAGVASSRYRPGRFSALEGRLSTIKRWYLHEMATASVPSHEELGA